MEYKTLGDVVHEALEEYHQEQNPHIGKFEKVKNSLEVLVSKHQTKILLGSAVVLGGLGWYASQEALNYFKEFYTSGAKTALAIRMPGVLLGNYSAFIKKIIDINEGYQLLSRLELFKPLMAGLGAGLGILAGILICPSYAGKRVYEKIKGSAVNKKIGRVFKHPNLLALGLTTGVFYDAVIKMPANLVSLYNMSKTASVDILAKKAFYVKLGMTSKDVLLYAGCFLASSLLFKIFRDIEAAGKKGWKGLGAGFVTLPIKALGAISKNSAIKILKRKAEKHNTFTYNYALGRAIFKKDISEGLNYCKDIVERNESDVEFKTLKKWSFGICYTSLYKKKKESWLNFFENLIKVNKENKEVTRRIVQKTRESTSNKKLDVHFLLNYFSEKYIQEPQDKYWSELAKNIVALSKEDKNIQEFKSSEGRVWVYTGSKLINRSLVLEEYEFDFFERFLKKRFEYVTLRNSEIKTESPLVLIRENGKSLVLTTREGDSNLRESLNNKSKAEKRKAFEKIIGDALIAQQRLYEKIRKENGGFCADVNYDNQIYPIKFNVLNLEEHLLHRAFIGDEMKGERFGANEYLPELLKTLTYYRQENYSPIIITLNHGDLFTTNITEKYVRIDARHVIADALHDITHISLDPIFLFMPKDEKVEVNFKKLKSLYPFCDEEKFKKSFNSLYLCNGLGLSAALRSHEQTEDAALVLNEALEFSKGKSFEKILLSYLQNSNARDLLKII